jgi:hypothetical protein
MEWGAFNETCFEFTSFLYFVNTDLQAFYILSHLVFHRCPIHLLLNLTADLYNKPMIGIISGSVCFAYMGMHTKCKEMSPSH